MFVGRQRPQSASSHWASGASPDVIFSCFRKSSVNAIADSMATGILASDSLGESEAEDADRLTIGPASRFVNSKRIQISFYPDFVEEPHRLGSESSVVIVRIGVNGDTSSLDWL